MGRWGGVLLDRTDRVKIGNYIQEWKGFEIFLDSKVPDGDFFSGCVHEYDESSMAAMSVMK